MRAFGDARPTVDQRLDQSHATAETAVRRALFLYENDALEGRSVVVLGDDDLTSLAIAVVAEALSLGAVDITVVEVDERLVGYIAASAELPRVKGRARTSRRIASMFSPLIRSSLPLPRRTRVCPAASRAPARCRRRRPARGRRDRPGRLSGRGRPALSDGACARVGPRPILSYRCGARRLQACASPAPVCFPPSPSPPARRLVFPPRP